MTDTPQKIFTAVDFSVFIVLLAVPSFIGVYFAWKDRKASSTNKYFFGEKRMHPIAIGISTAVTSISALTMIGYPAEVYLVGTVFFWAPVAIITAAAITIVYYVPFYSRLQLNTIYGVGGFIFFLGVNNKMGRFYLRSRPGSNRKRFFSSIGAVVRCSASNAVPQWYLELRFNATVRRVVAAMVMISEIFYMGITIYLPAIALSAVAPISINWSIVLIGGICTFYTTLGGMKAVVWTDVVQSVFMIFASVMLLVKSTIAVGGVNEVSAALERGNRTTFFRFDNFDVSSRMHPLAIAVGEFFVFTNYLGFAQPIYQRILSCKNTKQSQYSIIAYVIPAILIICISICNGLVMYAYFEGCDPVMNGDIKRRDQGIPYMALMEFSHVHGMAGLFVAAVFSGTLSTVSSGLNAYSAVFVEDFVSIILPKMSQKKKLFFGKIGAATLGVLVVAFAYVVSIMDQNVLKILRCFAGAIGGSVLGIYLLGIFLPWANSAGAIAGGGFAYATMVWIFIGSNFFFTASPKVKLPPISSDECPGSNETLWNETTTVPTTELLSSSLLVPGEPIAVESSYTFDQVVYSLNFHYYVFVGCTLTLVVGLITSLISGRNRPAEVNPALFLPIFDNPWLPYKVRKFFRCGVPSKENECEYNVGVDADEAELKALTPS